jgi:sigma-B regulation protein RsbU (phosphoserine phosphatase)
MTIHLGKVRVSFLIRQGVRYLLVSRGFYIVEAVIVLAILSFMLTGSRIAAIDHYGNHADIAATIVVTIVVTSLLTLLNRRVKTAIDRHFFGEEYNAKQILMELGEAIPTLFETKEVLEFIAYKIDDALHPQNVTIFLDDEDRGAYAAAYSSDTSNAGTGVPCPIHNVLLHHEGNLVSRLRESKQLVSVELTEADLLSLRAGLRSGTVLSDHESLTLRAVRSSVLIPIVSHHHLHGLISLGQRLSGLPYVKEDKLLLLIVANQIAAFIENRKLINRIASEERTAREVEMAAEVQRHLFPVDGFEDDKLELYGTCLPALGIAGDYYDYFEMDESSTGIAIADVAGKGIAAALLMSTVQASLRGQLITNDRSLSDVVCSMNKLLRHSTSDGGYASFFLAQFDKETYGLTYVNAGHNPPILIRRGSLLQRHRFGPGSPEAWLK